MEKIAETVSRLDQVKSLLEPETVGSGCSNGHNARNAANEPERLSKEKAEYILREAERMQERWGWDTWSAPNQSGSVPALDALVEKTIAAYDIPADQRERLLSIARSRQDQQHAQRRDSALKALTEAVGSRFAETTLESFEATTSEQRKVLGAVRGYAANIVERAADGNGVILFGSAGTGKTHLLAGLAKAAIEAGLSVAWVNGQDLFARFRAAIDGEGSESTIIRELVKPDVLILDDLLPPGGALTDFQASSVYRIVDARYRDCRSTWSTMNVSNGDEAERGMGAQIVDRLRHGALTAFCNWPSFRSAK